MILNINDIKLKKLNFDVHFLNIAKEISTMSKCVSHQVGALIVKEKRIISTGYNGTPRGFNNCNYFFDKNNFDKNQHHEFSEKFEIHAEINSILWAARNGISIEGADIYVTLHPCNQCLKDICNCGIKNIFYEDEYNRFENDGIDELLKCCEVNLIKINRK